MKLHLQVLVDMEDGTPPSTHALATVERTDLSPATLGLHLAEAKEITGQLQQILVSAQLAAQTPAQAHCPLCGDLRRRKGMHQVVYRTVFGKLTLPSPRYYTCPCTPQAHRSVSPLAELLPERTAPELRYLEVKWAALMSYGLTVDLLDELLPLGTSLATTSLRRQVQSIATRIEEGLGDERWAFIEGCGRDWAELPCPEGPIVAGLDGGYVRARTSEQRKAGCFEVIVAKSMPTDRPAKCMAFVQRYDQKPKRRLFDLLQSQGLQMNQALTFVTDGGDTVRELPLYLSPESEHLIDWFHITMRITVLRQYAKGMVWSDLDGVDGWDDELNGEDTRTNEQLLAQMEQIKWLLWHGNIFRTLQALDDLVMDVECEETPSATKLCSAVEEFQGYIQANQAFIPNYGERYRAGEVISSAFVESAVNQVISKRMVKQQQMRWTELGAHLLLQVRTQVLNNDLQATFATWYPGMELGAAQPASSA